MSHLLSFIKPLTFIDRLFYNNHRSWASLIWILNIFYLVQRVIFVRLITLLLQSWNFALILHIDFNLIDLVIFICVFLKIVIFDVFNSALSKFWGGVVELCPLVSLSNTVPSGSISLRDAFELVDMGIQLRFLRFFSLVFLLRNY